MECHEARLLIDERVHGTLVAELSANLDDHLRVCGDCREDLRQLQRVRELLSLAKTDAPPAGALTAIWKNVAAATPQTAARSPRMSTYIFPASARRGAQPWKLMLASSLGVAALLMVCFAAGMSQFGVRDNLIATRGEKSAASARAYAEPQGIAGRADFDADEVNEYSRKLGAASDDFQWDSNGTRFRQEKPSTRFGMGGGIGGGEGTAWAARPGDQPNQSMGRSIYHEKKHAEAELQDLDRSESLKREDLSNNAPADEKMLALEQLTKEAKFSKSNKDGIAPEEPAAPAKNNKADPPKAEQPPGAKPKIIKTGELTVEVKNYTDASRAAEALVIKAQGFIADSRTFDQPGGTKRGEIVVRVNPDKFEELYSELKKLGLVRHERAGGQDITAQYTDTEARIKNFQIAEERLQELIKSKSFIDKIQSLLEVERELARVRGEIESMQGLMRVWNNQLALSTIRLTLQEPVRPVPSGSLAVEVASLSEAKKQLDAALANVSAQLQSGQTTKRGDGTLAGTYTVSVKFGRFAEMIAAIKGLGRVESEQLQNQPFQNAVPEGAQDVPCELTLVLFERAIQLPSGTLSLEVSTIAEALPKLNTVMSEAQAAIQSNQQQRQPDGTTTANITLRVRAGNFAKLIEALPALGRITHRAITGEAGNVQGGAAEMVSTVTLNLFEQRKQVPSGTMAIEVGTFTDARDKLSALIKEQGLQVLAANSQQRDDGTWAGYFKLGIKADKMDTVVSQIEKFGRVKRRELTGLGLGDLSRVDPNVVGEVLVALEEKPTIAPQEDNAFRLLVRDTFGGFLTSMGFVIRGFGMLLPWFALFFAIGFPLWKWSQRKAAAAAPKSVTPPEEPKK